MARPGYLGIDESNHGRFPAIFVGVYSSIPTDTVPHRLNKIRSGSNFQELLGEREYRYVYIPKEFQSHFNYEDLKLIGWTELLKAFPEAEKVIVDGVASKRHRNMLKRLVPGAPPCEFVMKADELYPLVHRADAIALRIFRYYKRWKSAKIDGTKYHDHIITPSIEDYRHLFRQRRPKTQGKENPTAKGKTARVKRSQKAQMDEEIMEACRPLTNSSRKIGKKSKQTSHLKQCFISKKKRVIMY